MGNFLDCFLDFSNQHNYNWFKRLELIWAVYHYPEAK